MVKKHSYDIVMLYIDQIAITVFSLILMTALVSVSDSLWVGFGLSIFTTLFFGVIIYTKAWDLGAKDKLSFDSGRGEYQPLKGLVLSIFANIPNFVLSSLAAIFLFISKAGNEALYSIGGALLTISKFTMAIYLGIVNLIVSPISDWYYVDFYIINSVVLFIVPIISIAITQFGYTLGFREKKLFGGAMDAKRKK